jgi:cell division protein FtsQ
MDASQRLLGRGFLRFDMRDPTRFVARVDKQMRAIDGSAAEGQPPASPSAPTTTDTGPAVQKVNETI